MASHPDLESLYREVQSALKARDYDRAAGLLKQILIADENYRDASRLLAQIVKLKRRRWYNDMRIWGPVIGVAVIGLLVWLVPNISPPAQVAPTEPVTMTASPTITLTQTKTATPTIPPSPTVTPIPLTWKRISMVQEFPRNNITSIAFDPVDPDVMYVGTQTIGIYKTIDGGDSWQAITREIGMTAVTQVLINAQDPRLLLVQAKQGLYRSTDGGISWKKSLPGNIVNFLVDVLDPSQLYARLSNRNVLFKSTDHGESWKTIYLPTNFTATFLLIQGNRWYVQQSDQGSYISEDEGKTWMPLSEIGPSIYQTDGQGNEWLLAVGETGRHLSSRSSDNGITWERIPVQDYFLPTPNSNYTTTYAIRNDQLMKTQDGGISWQFVSPVQRGVSALAISPISEDTFAVDGSDGFEITRDGGRTWQSASHGIGSVAIELWIDPRNDSTWFAKTVLVGEYYTFGSFRDACYFYRSTDRGGTWQPLRNEDLGCNLAMDGSGDLYQTEAYPQLYNSKYASIIRSSDAGLTWDTIPLPAQCAGNSNPQSGISSPWVVPDPHQAGTLFSSCDNKDQPNTLFISYDSGQTWESASGVGGSERVNLDSAIQFGFPDSGNRVYLSFLNPWGPQIFTSADGGVNWQTCEGRTPATTITDILITSRVMVATDGEGVLASDSGCLSWNKLLGELTINTLDADPNRPDTIYTGATDGAHISFDGGDRWSLINDGLLGNPTIYSIVFDSQGNVYAATPHGIFQLVKK